ncbi:FeMo cofactor biosynthesis domain protein [Candidatus Moduliflexus flocculans]|uniref:FeMo cofactor biosynthesis domain protein n=1 Tax=Candidatus Moduliflexus flocculans TaxID=1499966 RepID=A0A0S6VXL4_9BACT|nr:FeMo cofactor biosynthesis domain protein [Candidatus Moduliflexus flocculans]
MKICIPVLTQEGMNSPISSHFGKADHFAMFDEETQALTFFSNTGQHHGGALTPAELIHQAGANVVLCGGLGVKAVQMFQQFGVQVYNQASGTVSEVLAAYNAGKLPQANDMTACHDHAH